MVGLILSDQRNHGQPAQACHEGNGTDRGADAPDNEWKNNSIVNLSNLEPGVYIVEVEFEHKKMSKKLIIH